ncbi:MAG: FAD-dependent oxidoreductase [Candidatus Saccharibacteria bacterium]|nr:FAD-dependent oxidoreductase [Candidatus Saccharibacteria bacterium]
MYDIAIVGAGPAGLTAGIYAVRANKKVIVFEALTAGGQIINTSHIDNYPVAPHITGLEFGQTLEKQAKDLDVEIEYSEVTHIVKENNRFMIRTEDETYFSRAVIIASGTSPRKLGLENEDVFVGKGISYCATCDGAFYKGKTVAVNGGGNSALHEALYLSDIAAKVYLIHRRNEFRASDNLVDKVKAKDNIELVLESSIIELLGDGHLQGIKTDTGREIELDGLFVSIGRTPNTKNLIDGLELVEGDYAKANEDCHTNIPGVFVAGDVRSKELRQLVTATSDGAIAATEAVNYLKEVQ